MKTTGELLDALNNLNSIDNFWELYEAEICTAAPRNF